MRTFASSVSRRHGAAIAVVVTALALTACAPDPLLAAPSGEPPADLVVVDFSVNLAQGVVATGTELTDRYGTYRQVELAEDAPSREFAAAVYAADVVELYGAELAAEGQSFAAAFLAQHYLDNPAVYDNSRENRFAHRDSTVDFIVPTQSQAWVDEVLDSASGWATDKQVLAAIDAGVEVPPYAPDQARYALRTFELESATINEADGGIIFTFAVEYDRPVLINGADAVLTTTGTYLLVAVADVNEDWFVSGWGQDVDSALRYWDGSPATRDR